MNYKILKVLHHVTIIFKSNKLKIIIKIIIIIKLKCLTHFFNNKINIKIMKLRLIKINL